MSMAGKAPKSQMTRSSIYTNSPAKYEFTSQSGTETKEDSFDYTYEDDAFVLSVPNGNLHKSNWEELTKK
mgnify:CR=1 FL=1